MLLSRDISPEAKEHRWTEESLLVYMKPAATGLQIQIHLFKQEPEHTGPKRHWRMPNIRK